jgi:hypothetical protein
LNEQYGEITVTVKDIVLPLPEDLYVRLEQTARATRQSLTDVLLHAVRAGSPPDWTKAPVVFQADLAALDRLNDVGLWRIARGQYTESDTERLQALLEKNGEDALTAAEQAELTALVEEADRFMLRKAHAAALLQWRGHAVPPLDRL